VIDHDNLENFRDPLTYDVEDAGYDDDRSIIEEWAGRLGGPLLDLGCGSGRRAISLALQGHQVTGVDITPEMVAWGRQKATSQGAAIDWVVADARTFRLNKQFAFIFMLAHVFQFFLTRADIEALLVSVREHLAPDGCFLFETRNPFAHYLLDSQPPAAKEYATPDGGRLIQTAERRYDPMTQIQHWTYDLRWLHPDGQHSERTERTALRYVYPQEIEALLHYNGFQIRECYGGWDREPLTATSVEMIYVCERRDQP